MLLLDWVLSSRILYCSGGPLVSQCVCVCVCDCVYIVTLLGGYTATCAAMCYPEIGGLVCDTVCGCGLICIVVD